MKAAGVPRATVVALFVGTATTATIYDVLPPVLPALSAHFGGGEQGELMAQLASTLPIFGIALAGVGAGFLIERFGVRPVLLTSLAVYGILGCAGLLPIAVIPFLASRLIIGIAVGLNLICGSSLLAASYQGTARALMTGRVLASGATCAVVFLFISGWVASISWRAPFVLHPLVAAFFAVPALLLQRAPALIDARGAQIGAAKESLARLRPALGAFGLAFSVVSCSFLFSVQMPLLAAHAGIVDPLLIAVVCQGQPLSIIVTALCYGWLDSRLGTRNILLLAFGGMAAGMLICGLSMSVLLLLLGTMLGGLGCGFGLPAMACIIMQRISPALVPRALGFATTLQYLGGSMAPLFYIPMRRTVGMQGMYVATASIIVIGMLAYRISQARRRFTSEAGASLSQ